MVSMRSNTHRAPLVAILNDDDLFEPERLAHVVSIFRERPWLGYYRNRISAIDSEGRAVPRTESTGCSWTQSSTDGSARNSIRGEGCPSA